MCYQAIDYTLKTRIMANIRQLDAFMVTIATFNFLNPSLTAKYCGQPMFKPCLEALRYVRKLYHPCSDSHPLGGRVFTAITATIHATGRQATDQLGVCNFNLYWSFVVANS
jgi:hypothetical protein